MENKIESALKEHEKLIAFMFLGFSVLLLALLAYIYPPEDKSGAQRIIDAAMGGLLLALGGAGNALFRISNATEQQNIADKTALAIGQNQQQTVQPVEVVNTSAEPVPTTTSGATAGGELPASERIG